MGTCPQIPVAWHPSGDWIATAGADGEPHLLFGRGELLSSVVFLPDGRLVSGGEGGEIRLWTRPQGAPLHGLPIAELIDRLGSLTNYRVVEDATTETGYRLEVGPIRGWRPPPVD